MWRKKSACSDAPTRHHDPLGGVGFPLAATPSGWPHFGQFLEASNENIQRLAGSLDVESQIQQVPQPGQRIDLHAKNMAPSPKSAPPSCAITTAIESGKDLYAKPPKYSAAPPLSNPRCAITALVPCPVRQMIDSLTRIGDRQRSARAPAVCVLGPERLYFTDALQTVVFCDGPERSQMRQIYRHF